MNFFEFFVILFWHKNSTFSTIFSQKIVVLKDVEDWYLRFITMPVSPDKQILIRFRVPPSSQGSITRRHSNRDFPTKLIAKNCRGMYRDNWWNWYASWIYWSTQPPKQAVSREVTSFLLLSCQRCHHGWLVDYYPKWGVKWLLILPFSSLTTIQSVPTSFW